MEMKKGTRDGSGWGCKYSNEAFSFLDFAIIGDLDSFRYNSQYSSEFAFIFPWHNTQSYKATKLQDVLCLSVPNKIKMK